MDIGRQLLQRKEKIQIHIAGLSEPAYIRGISVQERMEVVAIGESYKDDDGNTDTTKLLEHQIDMLIEYVINGEGDKAFAGIPRDEVMQMDAKLADTLYMIMVESWHSTEESIEEAKKKLKKKQK